ncbi:MAG: 3-deoxy-7-phosphoheptulonate synthase [Candidatus Promineifilaceae bacterium]
MIVIMQPGASTREISAVITRIEDLGYRVHLSEGDEWSIIGIVGNGRPIEHGQFGRMAGVERAVRVSSRYKLASRNFHPKDTVFDVRKTSVGGNNLTIIAGPSALESRSQIVETAWAIKEAGGHVLHGGAYIARRSPYAFQGLGRQALSYLAEAREATGLPIITEIFDPELVPLATETVDMLIIGSRNMYNMALLRAVGQSQKPCILKRAGNATIEEWLLAAEYLLNYGNAQIALCERGIVAFPKETRNTFDINAIPLTKQLSHLPIIADPSHGTGNWTLVRPISRAAIAAGAHGVFVNVHMHPDKAMCDGGQSLKPEQFSKLVKEVNAISAAVSS